MHYRTHCCGEHEPIKLSKEDDDLSRLIEVYLRQLFDDRAVSSENQKKLWEYYFNELSQAVDAGYKPNPEMYDPALAHSLKYNIAQFSAFKETSFRKQLEAALTKDGKILPWGEFKAVADELHIEYNRRWLKTEYHHTVAVANMAEKWQEFEADADLYPNLKIVTAGDARVRESHKILDGLTLPVNHSFWKSHTPPFDWGCRCGIVQTDEEASEKIPNFKFKKEHENNPYYSGQIFNGNPYELGLIPGDKKEAKSKATKYFNNKVLQSDRSEQFKTLSTTKKGKVLEHLLTKKGGDYNDIIKTATEFSKMGKTAELMPEINEKEKTIRSLIFPNLKSKTSNPDLKVGNLFFDIKRPKAIKNILGNANGASKQGAIAVISDSQLDKPLTDKIMQNRAIHIFKDKNYQFDQVIFLKDGKLIIFNRKGV